MLNRYTDLIYSTGITTQTCAVLNNNENYVGNSLDRSDRQIIEELKTMQRFQSEYKVYYF